MKTRWLRYIVQGGFVLLLAYLGRRHQIVGGGPQGAPPIDAYCPFGAVESLAGFATAGGIVEKTASSNFWIMGTLLIVVLLVGAVFCGWFCPLGSVAEWLYKARLKVVRKKLEFPQAFHAVLTYGRFLLLAVIVYFSFVQGKLWFENYDPFKQLFHFAVENSTTLWVIGGFVTASLMVERFWCRYLCPLGAIVGVASKISWLRIRRNDSTCIHCRKCEKNCPTRIPVENVEAVSDTRCIQCFRCVENCPVPETLTITPCGFAGKKVLQPVAVVLTGLTIFWGIIGLAQTTSYWSAQNPKVMEKTLLKTPADIKGWMKWKDVMAAYPEKEKDVIRQLNMPTDFDREKTLKVLGQEYGFEPEKVKSILESIGK